MTEVITGGELVLDLNSAPFSFPQERIPVREKRRERKVNILMNIHNLGNSIFLNEKIESSLFSINLSERA
jgi:hypothetical protein